MEEAKKVALRMARLPATAVKQNKEAINRAYDMRGLMANIEYGRDVLPYRDGALPGGSGVPQDRAPARPQGSHPLERTALQID